jgi:site-specific recombinase
VTETPDDRPPDPARVPPRIQERSPQLDYMRVGQTERFDSPLPPAVGFMIGIVLFIAVVGGCAMIVGLVGARLDTRIIVVLCSPILALVVAGAVQVAFGWRLVAAGAMTALGVIALVGCFGIAVICGRRW